MYLPIIVLAVYSFTDTAIIGASGRFSLNNYKVLFTTPELLKMIKDTLILAAGSAAIAMEVKAADSSVLSALAFLVFVLLYFPCIATIVAVRNEAGRGWALASMVYSTAVAWFVAWIVYHIALLL